MIKFDEPDLKRILNSFTRTQRIAFALLLCERMLPALLKFGEGTGFDVRAYRKSLKIGWTWERGAPADYRAAAQECFDQAPDTEQFDHHLVSAALNAALSIGLLMQFLADEDVDHLIEIARLARDTVALLAQDSNPSSPRSLNSEEVSAQPIVQRELRRQLDDLSFLAAMPEADKGETIGRARARARETPGMTPL